MTAATPAELGCDTRARQRQLNLPWTLNRLPGPVQFAHPAEAELARILTFYRIRWLYEPTSFVLRNGEDGRPAESFTPDFFLPEHRQYIELTTMRQALVTRKNRKLRQVRELYPGVNVKLLYRRDVERLFRSYDDGWQTIDPVRHGKVIADSAAVERRIVELASEIVVAMQQLSESSDAPNQLAIVDVSSGASTFSRHLVSEIQTRGVPIALSDISITQLGSTTGRQNVRILRPPSQSLSGRTVLLVADVVSSGLSLHYLVEWIRRRAAKDVQICAMFDRKSARIIDMPVRYAAFDAPDEPLVGYGIGACTEHRNLSFVASLDEQSTRRT